MFQADFSTMLEYIHVMNQKVPKKLNDNKLK